MIYWPENVLSLFTQRENSLFPPVKDPHCILEQLEGGVQDKGAKAAASSLVSASNPQSVPDN